MQRINFDVYVVVPNEQSFVVTESEIAHLLMEKYGKDNVAVYQVGRPDKNWKGVATDSEEEGLR